MVVKKFFIIIILTIFSFNVFANTPRSTGKYKNWESFTAETEKGKICFAQTVPTKRAPGAIQREQSKLFVTFRPNDKISDEISITSGYNASINNSELEFISFLDLASFITTCLVTSSTTSSPTFA